MTTSIHDIHSSHNGRLLTPEEAVCLHKASDPRVSPDGQFVYFCAGPIAKEGEHATGKIMRVPSDGGAPQPFTAGTALDTDPRPSPDGAWLAFISDRHEQGKPALYLMPSGGGEARRLVTERGEASDPQWSPDSTRVSFLLKEIDSEEEERRKKETRDDAIVVDDDKYTRLWAVDIATEQVTRLSPDGINVWAHTWAPAAPADGDMLSIAVLHTPTPKVNDFYNGSTVSTIAVPLGDRHAPAAGPIATVCRIEGHARSLCWSPDGAWLAFVAPELRRPFTSSAAAPLVVPSAGGTPRAVVTVHPAEFSHVAWLSDDVLVAAGIEGVQSVYYRITRDGADAAPFLRDRQPAGGALSDLSLGPDRGTLAVVSEDTTSPGDIWIARPDGALTRLTTLNPELAEMSWGAVERVSWSAPDGLEVQGLLIKPVGYREGTRYPTIVHVHGGPAWQWVDGFYGTWHDWDQFLAGRGYAVLLPNPRGSTGRGTAYVAANYDDVGGGEWQDVLAGARWAVESGIADPDRLGIGGWSWGGYLTSWAVTQTDIFKGAVMGAGLSNLLSDHGQNDIPDANRLYFRDLPYHDPAAYWDPSPIKYAARVTTPTLILHGEKDERVTPAQAREFYRALKTLGVPTQLVLYPREPHSFAERAHQLDVLKRIVAWFDKYVKGVISD